MSGTHRDLFFLSKSRSIASKNHTWGLGPMETSNSDATHAALQAQNGRWNLGPIEICYSGPKVADLHAKNHRWGLGNTGTSDSGANHAVFHAQNDRSCLGPIETCNSAPKVAEGLDPWRLVILMLITLFCKQKPLKWAGTNIDLIFWCKSGRFDCTKGQVRSGTHRDL